MKRRRPLPDDFARIAKKMDRTRLAAHYKTTEATVRRWIKETGFDVRRKNSRPMPRDFREVAPTMTVTSLCKRYGATPVTIRGWALSAGVTIPYGQRLFARPIPEGFASYARYMTFRQLQAREGVGRDVILRWRRESGLPEGDPPAHMVPIPDDFCAVAPTLYKAQACQKWDVSQRVLSHWSRETGVKFRSANRDQVNPNYRPRSPNIGGTARHDARLDTPANRAADILRRNRWQVSPCDNNGRYDPRGSMWRVGRVIVDEAEMIRRAEKYGSVKL